MPEFADFVESAQRARASLEQTHLRVLGLLDDPNLLRYADVRDLIRTVDGQIGALQQSLLTLRDTLTAVYAAHGEDRGGNAAEDVTNGSSDLR